MFGNRWLPLAFTTGAALALWALAAASGYAWQLIWLPAVVAGAAWPRQRTRTLDNCLRRLRRDRKRTIATTDHVVPSGAGKTNRSQWETPGVSVRE